MEQNYDSLLGKTKQEIVTEMKQEGNIYNAIIWYYAIKKDWLGRNIILTLHFQDGIVHQVDIKKIPFLRLNIQNTQNEF